METVCLTLENYQKLTAENAQLKEAITELKEAIEIDKRVILVERADWRESIPYKWIRVNDEVNRHFESVYRDLKAKIEAVEKRAGEYANKINNQDNKITRLERELKERKKIFGLF